MKLLQVDGLSKDFVMHIRAGKRISSFSDVSFSLDKGEFLGISGPSGIGKSSLLKCIYRSYLPTAGEILYWGKDGAEYNLASADEHTVLKLRFSEIGFVTQFFHVIPRIPAFDILVSELVSRGTDSAEAKDLVAEYLVKLAIPKTLWQMYPSTFSGGEKQRLNILHAVIRKPRLLLLDEPTASLDPGTRDEVVNLLIDMKSQGTGMIGVFHDHKTMKKLADHEYIFNHNLEAVG